MWVEFGCSECGQQNGFDTVHVDPPGERTSDGRAPFDVDCGECSVPYRLYVNPDHAERVVVDDDGECVELAYSFETEEALDAAWAEELERSVKQKVRAIDRGEESSREALLAYAVEGPARSYCALRHSGLMLRAVFSVDLEAVKQSLRS